MSSYIDEDLHIQYIYRQIDNMTMYQVTTCSFFILKAYTINKPSFLIVFRVNQGYKFYHIWSLPVRDMNVLLSQVLV